MSLFLNGIETNTLMFNGVETTGVWNGEVVWGVPQFKTLTLYNSEGGTLTANTLTGYPGDTISLSTAYNTYWRFSGYQLTGDGELVGNDYTFGTEDATICACYKVNAFTASGGWEKGSNVNCSTAGRDVYTTANVPAKYAIVSYHTSNVPTAWYNTSNRWKVNSNVSAYQITLNPKMQFNTSSRYGGNASNLHGGWVTAVSLIGSTATQQGTYANKSNQDGVKTYYYSKSFTSNTTGVNYGISAHLSARSTRVSTNNYPGYANYIATGTTGTWVATGIAP